MRIAAESEWTGFSGAEITRVGQEIAATFGKVAHPFHTTLTPLNAKVFIEIETAKGEANVYSTRNPYEAPKVQE